MAIAHQASISTMYCILKYLPFISYPFAGVKRRRRGAMKSELLFVDDIGSNEQRSVSGRPFYLKIRSLNKSTTSIQAHPKFQLH
jgi:hypothetical protein